MAEVVVLIGTKNGLWLGRSDAARAEWTVRGAGVLDAGRVRRRDRHPRRPAATVRRRDQRALGSGGLPLRRPRRELGRAAGGLDRVPGRRRRLAGAGLADPARTGVEPRGRVRRRRAVVAVALDRRGGDASSWSAGCGTTRTASSGMPASAARPIHTVLPHPTDLGRVTVAMSTGGVYRTSGRRRVLGGGQRRDQGVLPARPVAGVRAVRAQARRRSRTARTGCSRRITTASTAVRRRRQRLAVDRRRVAGRLRLPDRQPPARARTPSTSSRWLPTATGSRPTPGAGCTGRGTPGRQLAAADRRAARRAVVRAGAAGRDVHRRRRAPPGCTSGPATAACTRSADEGDTWTEIARHLPDVLSVRAAVWLDGDRRVRLPPVLRAFAGGADRVEVDGPTVGAALAALDPALRRRVTDDQGALRRHVNVYLGADNVRDLDGLDTALTDGAELLVLPASPAADARCPSTRRALDWWRTRAGS